MSSSEVYVEDRDKCFECGEIAPLDSLPHCQECGEWICNDCLALGNRGWCSGCEKHGGSDQFGLGA